MSKKRSAMIRMTISVKKQLKERMKAYQKNHKVNWSKMAAQCFTKYLEEHDEEKY